MSVTVKAHKNVVPDLEARCQELQQKLDLKSDELTHMTARKTAAEEVRVRHHCCTFNTITTVTILGAAVRTMRILRQLRKGV